MNGARAGSSGMDETTRRSLGWLVVVALLGWGAAALAQEAVEGGEAAGSPEATPPEGGGDPEPAPAPTPVETCSGPRRPLLPLLLTPITAEIPRDGAALVAGTRVGEPGESATALSFAGVTFTRRRSTETLTPITLAPGLVRLVPSTRLAAGPWVAHGLGPDATMTVSRRGSMPGAPVSPGMRAARRVAATSLSSSGSPRIQVLATMSFPVPVNIVAVLVYWNGESSPSTWARAVLGRTELTVYEEADPCEETAPGMRPPPSGDLTLALAFVDHFGQVSPVSERVTVE